MKIEKSLFIFALLLAIFSAVAMFLHMQNTIQNTPGALINLHGTFNAYFEAVIMSLFAAVPGIVCAWIAYDTTKDEQKK